MTGLPYNELCYGFHLFIALREQLFYSGCRLSTLTGFIMSIFELLEDAYAQARTLTNEREAAIQAGQRMDETLQELRSTTLEQSTTIIDLTRQRNKYKGTLAEQDGTIAAMRLELEDAHNTIANQQQEIASLRQQLSSVGQRLDAQRQNTRSISTPASHSGAACGSVVIGSTYDKDTNPRD